jgi:chromosome segregation ATPase
VVASAKTLTQARQADQAKAQLALNLASKQEDAAEATQLKLQQQFDSALEVSHRAQANLGTAKNRVAIAETAVANAKVDVNAAQADVTAAQTSFDSASAALKTANDAFVKAQNEHSQAQLDYQNALAA